MRPTAGQAGEIGRNCGTATSCEEGSEHRHSLWSSGHLHSHPRVPVHKSRTPLIHSQHVSLGCHRPPQYAQSSPIIQNGLFSIRVRHPQICPLSLSMYTERPPILSNQPPMKTSLTSPICPLSLLKNTEQTSPKYLFSLPIKQARPLHNVQGLP